MDFFYYIFILLFFGVFFYCFIISGILLFVIYVWWYKLYFYIDVLFVYILNKLFNVFIIGLKILFGFIDWFE